MGYFEVYLAIPSESLLYDHKNLFYRVIGGTSRYISCMFPGEYFRAIFDAQ